MYNIKYLPLISKHSFCTHSSFEPVCLRDFISHAERNIKADLFSYYQSGATEERTLEANEKAFTRILFQPRMLRDVSNRSINTTIMSTEISHPFGFAPTATHKIAHPKGELETALGAAITGTPMILSTLSSVPLEEVAKVYLSNYKKKDSVVPLWFQLYIFRDRVFTESLIKRAENSGFTALVVTVDTPISGIRYQNLRFRLSFPDGINYANLNDNLSLDRKPNENFFAQIASNFDDSLTWTSTMDYLRSKTKLPIILKGILSIEDAKLAENHGADGIIVSNHGARQLDSVPPSLECLARIAQNISSSTELYIDGGIRSGDDILKAIALGAKMVFIGRPVLWSLSYKGFQGVVKLVEILRKELDVSLALNGIRDINNVPKNTVVRASEYYC